MFESKRSRKSTGILSLCLVGMSLPHVVDAVPNQPRITALSSTGETLIVGAPEDLLQRQRVPEIFTSFGAGPEGLLYASTSLGLQIQTPEGTETVFDDLGVYSALWAPRSPRILAVVGGHSGTQLRLLDREDGSERLLATGPIEPHLASLSSDERLVSWIEAEGETRVVVVAELASGEELWRSEAGDFQDYAWSGQRILAVAGDLLLRIDPETGAEEDLGLIPARDVLQIAARGGTLTVRGESLSDPDEEVILSRAPGQTRWRTVAEARSLHLHGIAPTGEVIYEVMGQPGALRAARGERSSVTIASTAGLPYADFPFSWNETWQITQGYNGTTSHTGNDKYALDWARSSCSSYYIRAMEYGQVTAAVNNNSTSGYGTYVKINHRDGYEALYGHGTYNSLAVSQNQVVSQNTALMKCGKTGFATGEHLHQRLYYNGAPTKPEPMCGKSGFAAGQSHKSCQGDYEWKFKYSGNAEGWRVSGASLNVGNDLLYVNASTKDPYITTPNLYANPGSITRMRMRVRAPNTYGTKKAQVFFTTPSCAPSEARSKKVDITWTGAFAEVSIKLSDIPSWSSCGSSITSVRLDPVPAGLSDGSQDDTISFDWIRIE